MIRILGISGSLRKGSFNTSLLRAAQSLAGDGIEVTVATLHGIPLYDGDLEVSGGIPAAVTALREQIIASDGVLLATPEYNNGIPGVFKNAIDWLSRPPSEVPRTFNNRAFALLGASPGGFGTILSQNAWLPVLRTLGTRQWNGAKMLVSRAGETFDGGGKLTNEAVAKQLGDYVRNFAAFAAKK
jgi:chromate reductase, NAD(P)H dehydrogenase (quinone)